MTEHDGPSPGRAVAVPPRSVLAAHVYGTLRADLLDGRIAPGERLNLDALARRLHVSNTPVRQALAALTAQGLTDRLPNRGYRASPLLDARGIEELYEYRLLIEPPTAAAAAATSTDPSSLADPSTDGGGDPARRDVAFHLVLARAAGNRVVSAALAQALGRSCEYQLYADPEALARTAEEHLRIALAVRAGDPQGAQAAMRDHLRSAVKRLRGAVG